MARFLFLLPRDGFPSFGNSSYFSTRVGFHMLLLHDETSSLEKFLEVMGEGDIAGKHELSVRQTKELFDYRKVCQFDQNDRSKCSQVTYIRFFTPAVIHRETKKEDSVENFATDNGFREIRFNLKTQFPPE